MAELATIAWRNIGRNRRRTVLCLAAVAVSVFFIIFMESMIAGMVDGIESVVTTFDTGHVTVVSKEYEAEIEYLPVQYPLSGGASVKELAKLAESVPGVKAAFPRVLCYASLFDSTVKHALVWGIETERERSFHHFDIYSRTDGLIEGSYPAPGRNECIIGISLASKAGLSVGDSIPLKLVSAQFSDKYWSPVVTGIFSFDYQRFDENAIVVPLDRLQRVLGLGEGAQQLAVYAEREKDSPRIAAELRSAFASAGNAGGSPEAPVVREWTDNYWVAMMRSMTGLFVIVFLVFQTVASFLIVNTMLMVIHERIKEIGMMGALGMTRWEIVAVFFMEALFLSMLGAAAGSLVGGVSAAVLSLFPLDFTALTGGGMKDLPIAGTLVLSFSWGTVAKGFLYGVAVSSACTVFPSLKSAFVEPVEALRR